MDIDLTGITAGAGARLSFDLLGFGDRTSSIVLDNVLLTNGQPTAAPVAVNDAYTVAEGTSNLRPLGQRHRLRHSDLRSNSLQPNTLSGATIDPATGLFTWAVPVAQPLGATTVTVRVTDNGTPALFAERTVSITVAPLVNQAPVLAPIGAKSINEQTELRFMISATDADLPAQTLTYSATPLPPGAIFTPGTREFVWTPTEAQGPGSVEPVLAG